MPKPSLALAPQEELYIALLDDDIDLSWTQIDNNLTADPNVLEKLKEIKERDLTVDITQGIDVRLMTPEIAKALSEIKHLRSIHYAWDLMSFEKPVKECGLPWYAKRASVVVGTQ